MSRRQASLNLYEEFQKVLELRFTKQLATFAIMLAM